MNPEQYITDLANQIEQTVLTPLAFYHFCLWENSVQCRNAGHTAVVHPTFLRARGSYINDGLSLREWNMLRDKIAHCIEGNLL